MNKNEILVNFIIKGLKEINNITENINLSKTSFEFIKKQLPVTINQNFVKLRLNKNNTEIDETFFTFLKENESFFKNMKIYNLVPDKENTLQEHLSEYFNNIHTKYNEDKMFFFYFQLILMDQFMRSMGQKMPRTNLKDELMEVLKHHCFMEKKEMSKCLGDHLDEIDLIPLNEFEEKIDKKCQVPKQNLEQCVVRKLQ